MKHLAKHHNRLLSKFFKLTQVYFNPISFTLSRVFNFLEDPEHLILFAAFFVKVYLPAFANIYDILSKPLLRGTVGGTASRLKLWNCFKIYESISSERLHSNCDCDCKSEIFLEVGNNPHRHY